MKKWYRVCVPYANYKRNDFISPEGLNRESLQIRGWITRQPVYIGPRKPTVEEVAAWGLAEPAPVVDPEPAPVVVETADEPEPETAAIIVPQRRRGRPRHGR